MGPPKERSRDQRWWWQQYLGRGRSAGAGAGAVRCELSETGPSASAGACRPEPRPSRKEREGEREGTVTALLRLGDLDSAAWGLTGTLCFGARIADWMIGGGREGKGGVLKDGIFGGKGDEDSGRVAGCWDAWGASHLLSSRSPGTWLIARLAGEHWLPPTSLPAVTAWYSRTCAGGKGDRQQDGEPRETGRQMRKRVRETGDEGRKAKARV